MMEHEEHHERHAGDKKEADRHHGSRKRENRGETGGYLIGDIHIGKKNLWLMAGGALGALAALGLGKASKKIRPAAVGAVKEGYAFKEWTAGKFEELKEDVEDIIAEAVYEYQSDLTDTADTVKREKELLEKIEKLVEEKLAKTKPAKKEE